MVESSEGKSSAEGNLSITGAGATTTESAAPGSEATEAAAKSG